MISTSLKELFTTKEPIMKTHRLLFLLTLSLLLSSSLSAQDFSEAIRTAAEATMQATVDGDYEKLASYTYPPLLEFLDEVAGPDKTAVEFLRETMEGMKAGGASIEYGTVGDPTPHVVAGDELHAIIPSELSMNMMEMQIKVESYMIAVSSDEGVTWTFVNSSDNLDMFLPMLFPNWNDALKLPEKKEPEIIWNSDEDEESQGTEE